MIENNNIPPPLPPPDGYVPRDVATIERSTPVDGPGCENCGATPARKATFHQNTGMLFSRRVRTLQGTYCRNCGLALGRSMANRSLWTGWWGIVSFIVNVGYVLGNAGTLLRHGLLRSPRGGQGTLDPGRAMFLRSGVLVLAAVVAICVSAAVSAAGANNSYSGSGYVAPAAPPAPPIADWEEGACVALSGSTARPVPCTSPHDGTVVLRTYSEFACPQGTDGTVIDSGFTYCIERE